MSLDFLQNYLVLVIVGICLCVGYILKNLVKTDKINRFIPLIMGLIGLAMAIWINHNINPDIILAGLVSGLASTGMYEAFKNLLNSNNK